MSRAGSTVPRLLPAVLLLAAVAFPRAASAQLHKHHITLAVGYQKYLSDDVKDDATGVDFTNSGVGTLGYRFSLQPGLDLCLDSKAAVSSDQFLGADLTLTNTYFGPGIRFSGRSEGTRPYLQANLYIVSEEIEAEENGVTVSASDSGVGFGAALGVDIRASNLISIPIQGEFIYSKPADDVTGIGASVGITFNFGELR